jgi:hypothetical protein
MVKYGAQRTLRTHPDSSRCSGQAGTPRCFEEEELKAIENR